MPDFSGFLGALVGGGLGTLLLLRSFAAERSRWCEERNALLERLVPGSTPKSDEPVKTYPLGDDRREWLMSLDDETRQMVEREQEEGLALR
jgi:hypothetical protein